MQNFQPKTMYSSINFTMYSSLSRVWLIADQTLRAHNEDITLLCIQVN